MQETKKKRKKTSDFYRRQDRWALLMMTPWLIGAVFFFLKPLVEVIIYSLNDVQVTLGGLEQTWVGLQNFKYVLREHATFYQDLFVTFSNALPNTVLIIFFSLFAAVLLNGKFKFRGAARVLFFLPIVLATDLINVELVGVSLEETGAGAASQNLSGAMMLVDFMIDGMGLPIEVIASILGVISNVFETIKLSGVQILIFLAGLQSVSPSMYEVAKMEGATAYETFWKVTLPTVSPLVLTNVIYTLTDNLMRTKLVDTIQATAFGSAQYGNSAAMSVSFLVLTLVVVGVVTLILGKVVFYND